jgi:predicted transcriptional regulator
MKTLAIRLENELHAQLSVLAQLRQSTITDEIRLALENHLEASKSDPELKNRAQAVLDDIGRDAKAREAAIATLFSPTAEQPSTTSPKASKRSPR